MIRRTELSRAKAALDALSCAPAGPTLRAALLVAERAADDAECAADEASASELRDNLCTAARSLREAAARARVAARAAALNADEYKRKTLLGDRTENQSKDNGSNAMRLAQDVQSSLRRTTAVVQEEVSRTNATGDIVDDSSHRLRNTLNVHREYGDYLQSGADTLRDLHREERNANIAIGACCFIFFIVALYVAHKRVTTSNTATYVVIPVVRLATLPFRIFGSVVRYISRTISTYHHSALLDEFSKTENDMPGARQKYKRPPTADHDGNQIDKTPTVVETLAVEVEL